MTRRDEIFVTLSALRLPGMFALPSRSPKCKVWAQIHPQLPYGPPAPPQSYLLTSRGDSQNTLIIWISGASNLLFTLSHASEKPGADRCTGNPKWQFWPPEVRSLPQNLVQPPGEMSAAPYGAGKINNKMKITAAAGSRKFWKKKMKFKDEEREVIN